MKHLLLSALLITGCSQAGAQTVKQLTNQIDASFKRRDATIDAAIALIKTQDKIIQTMRENEIETSKRIRQMYKIIRELDVTGKYNDTTWGRDSIDRAIQFNPFKYNKY